MPHVDEGQLHAYLDRGPGAATESEWATFESHLALCEDCQGRLEEARRIRDRAHEILASVGPAEVAVPPFESLVARSNAGGDSGGGSSGGASGGASRQLGPGDALKRKWRSGNFPLAWAATIMVAVGAGWMARQVTMSSSEFDSLAKRPAAESVVESAETQPAIGGLESVDRLEAKVDDELAGGRLNEANNQELRVADGTQEAPAAPSNRALPSEVGADLKDAADQRAAAKSVVVTEVELAQAGVGEARAGEAGAGERAQRQAEVEPEDSRSRAEAQRRDAIAQVDVDNQRKAGDDASGVVAREADVAAPEADVAAREAGDAAREADAPAVGAVARNVAPEEETPAADNAALGCYELDVEWGETEAPPLPARLRLLAAAVTPDPSGGEYFREAPGVRAYELGRVSDSESPPGYWVPLGTDSVIVRVLGEVALVELRLEVADGELNGTAHAMSPDFADSGRAAAEGLAANPGPAPATAAAGSARGRGIDCPGVD